MFSFALLVKKRRFLVVAKHLRPTVKHQTVSMINSFKSILSKSITINSKNAHADENRVFQIFKSRFVLWSLLNGEKHKTFPHCIIYGLRKKILHNGKYHFPKINIIHFRFSTQEHKIDNKSFLFSF